MAIEKKYYENEEKEDIKFPELLSYENLLYSPATSGTLGALTITSGGYIKTAKTGQRTEIINDQLIFYDSNEQKRLEIGGSDMIYFRDETGVYKGLIQAVGNIFRVAGANDLALEAGPTSNDKITFNKRIEPTTNNDLDFGTPDKRIANAHFGSYIYSWYSILPNTDPSYSSLGESTRYWQYLWAYYVRYKDLAAFQKHDDISLIKNIKDKTITRYQVKGYDEKKKPIKAKEIADVWDETTFPEKVYQDGFYDAGAVNGLVIGTLKQLIEKVEILEQKVENKLK